MLEVHDLEVAYDGFQVLWGATLRVEEGEVVCLLGPNGAGKSTLVNTISGLVSPKAGDITFLNRSVLNIPPYARVEIGISHVLERRRLFPHMTVLENLLLGAHSRRARQARERTLDFVFEAFPALRKRRRQLGRDLSGGEQQMCAIARGLMSNPRLLIVDEPFLGLAPSVVIELANVFEGIRGKGVSVLFVEQNVEQALRCSDRAYILEVGRVALSGKSTQLLADPSVKAVYVGL